MPKVLYLLPVLLFMALTAFFFSYEKATSPINAAAKIQAKEQEPEVLGADPELIDFQVDINCGDPAQWEQLPGIGRKKAEAIVDYIKTNGPLVTPDELIQVKGIGEKTLEALRPYLAAAPSE